LNASAWQRAVEKTLGARDARWSSFGGSDWGRSYTLVAGDLRYFVKTATGRHASTIDAEADGIAALAATRTIRVPHVVAQLTSGDQSILVLEWLDLRRARNGPTLGKALAALHRATPPRGSIGRFGWHRDNWIGGTPQHNGWADDWCAFFRERRLGPQLEWAARNGADKRLQRDGDRLLAALPALLRHEPAPSLLHGDLWSGNAAVLPDAKPAIFDPAVYVGDREADIAMTELFGGFGGDFYAAYGDAWAVDADYEVRRDVYNLYHVLNHFNLFGGGYAAQAEATIARLVALVV
jgi:protein-ribulosamine 3-kinase